MLHLYASILLTKPLCAALVDDSEAGPRSMDLVTSDMYSHIRDVTAPLVLARPQVGKIKEGGENIYIYDRGVIFFFHLVLARPCSIPLFFF